MRAVIHSTCQRNGTRLVSGSDVRSVKVWAMRAGAPWACELTLVGHYGRVFSLATWQGKVLSGSADEGVRVWDVGIDAHDATLAGHEDTVCGLAVHGSSTSRRVHSPGTSKNRM